MATRWMYEGSEENIWSRITEQTGEDITPTDVFVQYRATRDQPDNDDPGWQAPDEIVAAGSVKRVAQLVQGVKLNGKLTKYWVWVKVVDTPEEVILKAGYFTVR